MRNILQLILIFFAVNAASAETDSQIDNKALVIVGPSGVGKGTLLKKLYNQHKDIFSQVVSTTTRAPRPGERNGKDYIFITKQQFEEGIAKGEFVEYVQVHGNYYGIHISQFQNKPKNKICILEIDYKGALLIKKNPNINAYFIFITCDGETPIKKLETLYNRLKKRNTEKQHEIERRLFTAMEELCFVYNNNKFFDYVLVNGSNLNLSLNNLIDIINKLYPKLNLNKSKLAAI